MDEEEKKKKEQEAAEAEAENANAGSESHDDDDSESEEEKPDKGEGQSKEDEQDSAAIADDLLSDGTPASKDIRVKFDKFKDVSEKAKLYEQFAPTLKKIEERAKDDPKFLDSLLETAEKGDLKGRLERIEEELNAKTRSEVRQVLIDAVDLWGKKFQTSWNEIKPLADQLQKTGKYSYREAVQRATLATVPELLQDGKRLVRRMDADRLRNQMGKNQQGGSAGYSPASNEQGAYAMTDGDKTMAIRMGIDPKLYSKHADFLKQKGFDLL